MSFSVGQLVVTIADWELRLDSPVPKRGVIYTVRDVVRFPGGLGLRLVELVSEPFVWSNGTLGEAGYAAEFFRPVVESRLAVFRKMLERQPSGPERVEAALDDALDELNAAWEKSTAEEHS